MTYTGDIKNTWTQFEITLPVHVIAVTCFAGPEGLPLKQKGYPILSELALLNKPTPPLEPQPTEVCVPSDHTYFPVHHVFFLSLLVEEFRHGLCACGLQHESQCLGEGGREGGRGGFHLPSTCKLPLSELWSSTVTTFCPAATILILKC